MYEYMYVAHSNSNSAILNGTDDFLAVFLFWNFKEQ